MKNDVTYKCIRFSEWLESMMKDIDCAFGIMKGRLCVLRYGVRLKSIEKCDEIWKTCCVLHNRLLSIDGLQSNMKFISSMKIYMAHSTQLQPQTSEWRSTCQFLFLTENGSYIYININWKIKIDRITINWSWVFWYFLCLAREEFLHSSMPCRET